MELKKQRRAFSKWTEGDKEILVWIEAQVFHCKSFIIKTDIFEIIYPWQCQVFHKKVGYNTNELLLLGNNKEIFSQE